MITIEDTIILLKKEQSKDKQIYNDLKKLDPKRNYVRGRIEGLENIINILFQLQYII